MADAPIAVRKGFFALAAVTVLTVAYIWSYTDAASRMSPLMWVLFIGTNGLFVLFLVLTWRRHDWARWATIVWTAIGTLALPWYADASSSVDRIIQLLIIAVDIWGSYHLLSKPASSWFHRPASA
jgi:uncharacterized membrane protein